MSDPKPAEERLLEQALSELVGGNRPPDQAEKILAAAAASPSAVAQKPATGAELPRGRNWRPMIRYAVAASVLLLVGGLAAMYLDPGFVRHPVAMQDGALPKAASAPDRKTAEYDMKDDSGYAEFVEGRTESRCVQINNGAFTNSEAPSGSDGSTTRLAVTGGRNRGDHDDATIGHSIFSSRLGPGGTPPGAPRPESFEQLEDEISRTVSPDSWSGRGPTARPLADSEGKSAEFSGNSNFFTRELDKRPHSGPSPDGLETRSGTTVQSPTFTGPTFDKSVSGDESGKRADASRPVLTHLGAGQAPAKTPADLPQLTTPTNESGDRQSQRLKRVELKNQEGQKPPVSTPPVSDPKAAQPNQPVKNPAPSARTWKAAAATANASQLMVGDHDGLGLVGMQTSVQIDGFRARVVTDYYYYNDRDQQLEGSFKLRLPNEATLFYFAFGQSVYKYEPESPPLAKSFLKGEQLASLGRNGAEEIFSVRSSGFVPSTVKEARVVPREQAAFAYAESTRRRVDPALVEWAGAGIFQARVFPLAPRQLHRIVAAYDMNLTHDGKDLAFALELPADRGETAVDLQLASLPGRKATVSPEAQPFIANNRAIYHFDRVDAKDNAIRVRIENPGTLAVAGGGEDSPYFATEIAPELPAAQAEGGSDTAVFLLDTSLSSQPERFNRYLRLLDESLKGNRDRMKRFALLVFNVEQHWWQEKFVDNTPENARAALDYCNTLALEGATDLAGALTEAAAPHWAKEGEKDRSASRPDLFLLSDGNATWGELSPMLLTRQLAKGNCGSLFAYSAGGSGTAVGLLEHLARETGGTLIAIAKDEEIPQAAAAHRQRPWQLLGVEVAGGSDILVSGRPRAIYPGQRLLVTGRGRVSAGSEVKLLVRRGEERKEVSVPVGLVVPSELAGRAYGSVATAQLEDLAGLAQDVAAAYARHFRVTGQTCSLLMLETEADYQRYQIKPEEDQLLVRSSPAGEYVVRKLDELARQLVEPKAAVQRFLSRLEKLPGVHFQTPAVLKLALEKMPDEAFEVRVPRLDCRERTRDKLSGDYSKMLATGEMDYDQVSREAVRRFDSLGGADALKALSSLIEQNPGDMVLARDAAYSAAEWKLGGQAYGLLKRVALARPYEPQTYLALARCLAEMGRADLAMVYYEVAIAGDWDGRFGDFRKVAQVEYLQLLNRIKKGELVATAKDLAAARYEEIARTSGLAGADLVVVMQWNTDRNDVDLHVTEPSGETCMYNHASTAAGGQITRDVTQGFGPEMYSIRSAPAGKYQVQINYFSGDRNRAQARCKVYANVYQYLGTDREQVTTKAITLSEGKETRDVLSVEVKK